MKCKVKRKQEKEKLQLLKKIVEDLQEINPEIEFLSQKDGSICTSCKHPEQLSSLKLPPDLTWIGQPEEDAYSTYVQVKTPKGVVINIFGSFL